MDNNNNINPFLKENVIPPTEDEKLNTAKREVHFSKSFGYLPKLHKKLEKIYSPKYFNSGQELYNNIGKSSLAEHLESRQNMINKIAMGSPLKQYEDLVNVFKTAVPSLEIGNLMSVNSHIENISLNETIINASSNLKSYIANINPDFLDEEEKAEILEGMTTIESDISSTKTNNRDLKDLVYFLANMYLLIILHLLPDSQLQAIEDKLEHISRQNEVLIDISTQELKASVLQLEVLHQVYLNLTQEDYSK